MFVYQNLVENESMSSQSLHWTTDMFFTCRATQDEFVWAYQHLRLLLCGVAQ